MKSKIKIYRAKKIITMDDNKPFANYVAVQDDRILAVGDYDQVTSWGDYELIDDFSDFVFMPGFVEGHAHMLAGGIWQYIYLGFHDRITPDGNQVEGLTTVDAILKRLKDADEKLEPNQPLICWGFDPIFLQTGDLYKKHLDTVSEARAIVVIHSNFHLMTANSKTLAMVGYDDQEIDIEGIDRDEHGELTGRIQEMYALFPIFRRLDISFQILSTQEQSVLAFGQVCNRAGVTTATDLYADIDQKNIDTLQKIVGQDDFPLRVVPVIAVHAEFERLIEDVKKYEAQSTDKLRLGQVKLMTDGSIQGFTARVKWPYYFKGPNHGIWNMPPELIEKAIKALHQAKIKMHIHANGDEAIEFVIDAIEQAIDSSSFVDHRHTIQHCQMASIEHLKKMARLGISANFFANHIYYFGDQHAAITLGEERAQRMNACQSALENNVLFSIHSDAPVTPLDPLLTAWCAINRLTSSGKVLGHAQKITLEQALYAITLGAAHTLNMEREIGSISVGKKADFTLLEKDPYEEDETTLKDIQVKGTFVGGKAFMLSN